MLFTSPLKAEGLLKTERCPNDSLGEPEAKKRHSWAMSCSSKYRKNVHRARVKLFEDESKNKDQKNYATLEETPFMVYRFWKEGQPLSFGYPGYHYVRDGKRVSIWKKEEAPGPWASCEKPENVMITRVCPAGCYTGDQLILVDQSGASSLKDLERNPPKSIVTLTSNSTLNNLSYQKTPLRRVVKDGELVEQDFVHIETLRGGIVVTPNHPMLLSNGKMQFAKALKVGDQLLKEDGSPDEVVSLNVKKEKRLAYNVEIDTNHDRERIVVAEGFLTGDLYHQNAAIRFMNSRILRDQPIIPNQAR